MNRQEKQQEIENLQKKFNESGNFYVTDTSALTVAQISNLRRVCFEKGVELKVAKNTLIKKALEANEMDYSELEDAFKGTTALMFSEVGNLPAKIIKDFRKSHDRPILKAASIEMAIYLGDEQIEALTKVKSKDELIGDVIALLQSPAKNVISGLKSGGGKLAGILQTLSERPEA